MIVPAIDPNDVMSTFSFSWPEFLTDPPFEGAGHGFFEFSNDALCYKKYHYYRDDGYELQKPGIFSFPSRWACVCLEEALSSVILRYIIWHENDGCESYNEGYAFTFQCLKAADSNNCIVTVNDVEGRVVWSSVFTMVLSDKYNNHFSRDRILAAALINFDIENHDRIWGFKVSEDMRRKYYKDVNLNSPSISE